MDKALIIREACSLILNESKQKAIKFINNNYKFTQETVQKRAYTDKIKMQVFLRDGFIDRYTGDKLLIPGILIEVMILYEQRILD
ncbi:hypothetical protein [Clostridium sp. JN-9]|uniref:hypothetical protein n=1 Tax=Clostridium sp. JN-9 TaxID=2507159 RepID=UPI000FFDFE84|nr:hypothetical protein [Clostridium sp. JN-9]QAT39090.1 hypothetical protein EQM05_01785 [Clostridium sp. JN-9]